MKKIADLSNEQLAALIKEIEDITPDKVTVNKVNKMSSLYQQLTNSNEFFHYERTDGQASDILFQLKKERDSRQ